MKTNMYIGCSWRRHLATTLLCCFAALSPCHAQSGMHISALFEGKIVPAKQMVETRIRGKSISKYKLSFFHSVRFKADEALVKKIDRLTAQDFISDSEKIKDRQPSDMGRGQREKGNTTFTQMYELAPRGSTNRYLCYKVHNDVMTVIYLEGSVSSLEELMKIFQ